MSQETSLDSLGSPQLNQDDSRLVDSILNDLNNSKSQNQPEQLSQEDHQAMLAQRQEELMQQQMMQQQMMQQQAQQSQQNVVSGNLENSMMESLQVNAKYIIIVIILSILINIGPVDDIFKMGETYFVDENGSLNIQAVIIKGIVVGLLFFVFKFIIPE